MEDEISKETVTPSSQMSLNWRQMRIVLSCNCLYSAHTTTIHGNQEKKKGYNTTNKPPKVLETKSIAQGYCLYMQGKVDGERPIQFFQDTGANDNVLTRSKFNALPQQVKENPTPTKSF